MKITTTLTTTAVFNDDQSKRYLLEKVWDDSKPRLAVIMLTPSEASGIVLDSTTLLVLNNASRLGYGSVSILNLFARVNDFNLTQAEEQDEENLRYIKEEASKADTVVYAAGVGKKSNKKFQKRESQVMEVLRGVEDKLYCIGNASGNAKMQHPLSPAVREWVLYRLDGKAEVKEAEVKKRGRPKKG